jgi:hypothetical protein
MMPRFAQVGNRIINLELITNAMYVPSETEESRSFLFIFFANANAAEQFTEEQADQLWRVLKDASFRVVL